MIAIEAIKFNHDDNSATHDALNIRKNATQFVHVPEWRRFIPQGLVAGCSGLARLSDCACGPIAGIGIDIECRIGCGE